MFESCAPTIEKMVSDQIMVVAGIISKNAGSGNFQTGRLNQSLSQSCPHVPLLAGMRRR